MAIQPKIRRATEKDLDAIAKINAGVFLGNRNELDSAREWVTAWFRSFPVYQFFVMTMRGKVVGYTGWQIHGGFQRAEPSIELEQIGVHHNHQGHGYAGQLITDGFRQMSAWIQEKNSRIESHITFFVWVYAHNENASRVYAAHFTDGIHGYRTQYGGRSEMMYRVRLPMVRPRRHG